VFAFDVITNNVQPCVQIVFQVIENLAMLVGFFRKLDERNQ